MSINLRPLNQDDDNYLRVIDLYKSAFTTSQNIPRWLLRFKLRRGKLGFNVIYENDTWIGLIYMTEHKGIVFVHFFAISEPCRSGGYGSKVIDLIKVMYAEKKIVLNIEKLDKQTPNYLKRVKRKAFYERNGFNSSGYIVQEPREELEMLIFGGRINKEEIEAMYRSLFGHVVGFLLRPKVIKK